MAALSRTIKVKSERETLEWAKKVARALPPGAAVALSGDLGAGKTTFCRGLCAGLGVKDLDSVTSPTFTLLNEYPGKRPVSHFDFYRVDSMNSLPELGFGDALSSGATVLVEWAEKFPSAFPPERTLRVGLSPSGKTPGGRQIDFVLPEGAGELPEWRPLRKLLER